MNQPTSHHAAREAAAAAGLADVRATETVHHPSRLKANPPARPTNLNMAAMLDICFQLLIFFVLTASFAAGEGILPADLPTGESQTDLDQQPPSQPIHVHLRSLGGRDVAIDLGGDPSAPTDYNDLFQRLTALQVSPERPTAPYNADDPVIIHAESRVPWNHLVNAFNAAVRARYTNVHFAQPTD